MEWISVGIMTLPIIMLAVVGFSMFPKTQAVIESGLPSLSCKYLIEMSDAATIDIFNIQDEIQKQMKEKNCLGDKP